VEALAVFIQTVARNAQSSVEAAQDALHNAAHGQAAVRQTIEGMMLIRENVQQTANKITRLGERSNEIGEIVRIIEDIADQTNLLALNAAIQSAMAGEHGRGFAVVADEIRLLAERSTESTKRIATLVKSIQGDTYEAVVAMEDSTQEVVKGSQLADDAGRSLNSIYTAVERQAQMIEGIARSANDQTTVSEAVAVAMSRISEITRQTDAGTQEAAVSVSYLAELSEQLRASVSTFRLPDRANEGLGSYSGSGSLVEDRPGGADNQLFTMTPALSGAPGEAHQPVEAFSGAGFDFGSLPELGNGGSFLPVPSREGRGQYEFAASAPMNMNSISSVGNAEELPTEFANERLKQPALPQSGIGQWANLPPSGMGQQSGFPQSGVGQWSNLPSSGIGQQPALPQSGIGQWANLPPSGMGQQSGFPQSGVGQQQSGFPQSGVGQWPNPHSGIGLPSYPSSGQAPGSAGLLSGPTVAGVPSGSARPRWADPSTRES
jgi:hypothetical protein